MEAYRGGLLQWIVSIRFAMRAILTLDVRRDDEVSRGTTLANSVDSGSIRWGIGD